MNASFDQKSLAPTRKSTPQGCNLTLAHPSRTLVRAKLEMTQPGDQDEQEADAVASTIVGGGKISRQISGGTGGSSGIAVSSQMENQLSRLQGGGRQMPDGLRSMMESGFGRDFSQVRLHTDPEAASMSSSIHAKAFTHGNDIYFNKGQYSPQSRDGQQLVAHELAHVAQGSTAIQRKGDDSTIPPGISEEDYEIAQNSSLIKPEEITNSFPTEVGDFSEASKHNLDTLADKVISGVSEFFSFAYGFTLSQNQAKEQVDIPDIKPLLKDCNRFLLQKGKKGQMESRLRSKNKDFRIELNNPEVRKYLMNRLSDTHVDLFYLWMKYSPDQGPTNSLAKALGLRPLGEKDFVEHRYTLNFLSSVGVSKTIIVGFSLETAVYRVTYENNLGLQWSMLVDRNSAGISAGIDFSLGTPIDVKVCAADDLCGSKQEVSKKWFSPYDFAHSNASMAVDASLHAGAIADASAGAGILSVNMPGKGELLFDMTGPSYTVGGQVGVGASYSMSGSFGLSDARGFAPNADPRYITPKQRAELEKEGYLLISEVVWFDTGSADVFSKKNRKENEERLKRVVQITNEAYKTTSEAGTLDGIHICITGNASPRWRAGKQDDREANNLELSQRRAESTKDVIKEMLGLHNESAISFLLHGDFLKTTIDQSMTTGMDVSAEGDKAAMEITEGDINNNDAGFRTADINVYLMLKRSLGSVTRI